MARPVKQGVDYFPLDVHMDDKFKFIEIKHGLEGFAIVIKLMQRVYSLGYWCKWTEDELLLFSDEIKSNPDKVQSVVNECLERDVFNKELHDNYNILTSTGIQKRYKEIVRRRKDVEVTVDYLLIDDISRVNDGNNPTKRQHDDGTMQTSSSHDDVKSTQSKVKESKGKNKDYDSKIRDLSSHFSSIENFNELGKKYWNVIKETRKSGKISKSVIYNNMNKWTNYDPEIVEYALNKHTNDHKGMREEYTIGIMRNTKKSDIEYKNNTKSMNKRQTGKVARF